LWVTSGTTHLITVLEAQNYWTTRGIQVAGSLLLVQDGGSTWISDGTTEGTFKLPLSGITAAVFDPVEHDGTVYFKTPSGGFPGYSSTIWATDGTPNGTHAIFTGDFASLRAFEGDNLLISSYTEIVRVAKDGTVLGTAPVPFVGTNSPFVAYGVANEPHDNAPPTLQVDAADADNILVAGETSIVTFDFSEAVKDFSLADVTLSSPLLGFLDNLTPSSNDPTVYTATLVAHTNVRGAVTLNVGTDYTDLAGNTGTAAEVTTYVNTALTTVGSAKDDKLNGTKANDNLSGLGGDDALKGDGGDDWLFGGADDDLLNGGPGNDWLFGGPGNDKLTGSAGADLFVFNQAAFGNNTVTDFTEAQGDHIDLRGLRLSYDDLAFSQPVRVPSSPSARIPSRSRTRQSRVSTMAPFCSEGVPARGKVGPALQIAMPKDGADVGLDIVGHELNLLQCRVPAPSSMWQMGTTRGAGARSRGRAGGATERRLAGVGVLGPAFGVLDPQAENVLGAVRLDAEGDVDRLVADHALVSTVPHLVLREGCRWRALPDAYGPRTTVYNRFNRWSKSGLWQKLLAEQVEAGAAPDLAMIDSSAVKAHRSSSGAKGGNAIRRSAARAAGARPRSTRSSMAKGDRMPSS
jgi:transposase